jgi:nucleotide-binding universal stress UspA family protein
MPLFCMKFSRILLCIDGEPHTESAIAAALELVRACNGSLDALYVVDPYLKKFTTEIYAVNRDACRDHLDSSLLAEGEAALDDLVARAGAANIGIGRLVEHGPPDEVIPRRAADGNYDLVVLGGKRFHGRLERWTSRDLPGRLDGKLGVPVLLCRV